MLDPDLYQPAMIPHKIHVKKFPLRMILNFLFVLVSLLNVFFFIHLRPNVSPYNSSFALHRAPITSVKIITPKTKGREENGYGRIKEIKKGVYSEALFAFFPFFSARRFSLSQDRRCN
jgi:hypothetical protein